MDSVPDRQEAKVMDVFDFLIVAVCIFLLLNVVWDLFRHLTTPKPLKRARDSSIEDYRKGL